MLKSIHPFFIAKNVMMMDRFFLRIWFLSCDSLHCIAHTFLKGVFSLSCRRCAAENYGVTFTRAILRLCWASKDLFICYIFEKRSSIEAQYIFQLFKKAPISASKKKKLNSKRLNPCNSHKTWEMTCNVICMNSCSVPCVEINFRRIACRPLLFYNRCNNVLPKKLTALA